MSDELVKRLEHCSENCGDEYLHELSGKAAALIRDLQQQLKTAREEERERCAKWHDEQARMLTDAFDNSNSLASSFAYRAVPFHEQAAAAIRSLEDK